jgi:membrane-bound lytic murein transglycosylase A
MDAQTHFLLDYDGGSPRESTRFVACVEVPAGRKPGSDAFPNKGAMIGRRDGNGQLVPYYDRAAIEAGALDREQIQWILEPAYLYFLAYDQIRGAAVERDMEFRIGKARANYDSHNGYSFSSLSRALIEHQRIPREEISPQRIREWMTAHPDEAAKERAANRSYVFFRVTGLSNGGEPVGAQGVPLTPGRSIAVDRLHDYGTPFFIEANLAIESANRVSPFHRLMIAQDTGSAIVGPARADLYWGAGDDAARIANRIHNPGRFVMLLPRELDMIAAGKNMPLPLPKPKIPEVEVRNENGRGNATFAKSKLDPRAATAYARASTGAHIDFKPSVSRSAARSVPLSKQTMRAGAFPHQVVPQISAGR